MLTHTSSFNHSTQKNTHRQRTLKTALCSRPNNRLHNAVWLCVSVQENHEPGHAVQLLGVLPRR